ncbi:probable Co/Zn/Cd efflux system membrane fusion protein [Stutzerimonas stutzeri]|uniref:efflux RND transporter periplasmic adaptor subunit n=1 Tax=Pseudomonadaceae TaxID=135621 RepID=UPI001625B21A|nr:MULTISPECIES: efflux RND transporter periplasmic adaptor subunit [Pseudomonadaceae]MDH0184703.1 efflux RND transporter periplasmic adaptor subunit [Stutzerimonas stutzeri]MDH1249146.1 efflux RND transporter periplasmic adaptor subunit [Stutzerimonas stutzeri]GBC54753.1 probable Co/Zn/Cd efflux system membrane fusion protein [Stutzerimonas stutzeri]HBP6433516.1 HlyD family secretion protein [Pseudomonas aeruginosa]
MNRLLALFLLCPLLLAACSPNGDHAQDAVGIAANEDYERGPNNGRLLRDGDFALEVTIYETNAPPHYRLYAYRGGRPVAPNEVTAIVELSRLDGEVNRFTFTPENDYLAGSGEVTEPHSFDVAVTAEQGGKTSTWSYDSYEGRVTIPAAIAEDAGIRVEPAGPTAIRDVVRLMGTIELDANRHAVVRARFPGIVRSVSVQQGERVQRGQTLAVVEGNESLRTYSITAPFDGVVLARNTNVGDVAEAGALFELADLSQVWIDLRAIGTDADLLEPGQPVRIRSATGGATTEATIGSLLPVAGTGQSVIARVSIPNPEGRWRPGMTVAAEVTAGSREVPLAVKESGLQRFRDFTVVFAQVGETYEVRMLELGDRDGEYAEVLGGLKPGTPYVTEQSFLIRQDIEKSGASHDH